MRKQVRYVNHLGEELNLFGDGIYCDSGETHDWEWSYQSLNGYASGFYKAQREFPLTLVIAAGSEERGLALRNRLFEIAEKDVLAKMPGAIHSDGWYMRCYVKASRKDVYWLTGAAAKYELTILADDPTWVREHTVHFTKGDTAGGMNFPFTFPFNFGSPVSGTQQIENPGFIQSPVRITVYGPASHPSVVIGGNRYEVECEVPAGGKLVIDGTEKKITVEDAYGSKENAFHLRRGNQYEGSGSYVFQRIAPGYQLVSWNGSFAFDATVYEQRGEKRWGI